MIRGLLAVVTVTLLFWIAPDASAQVLPPCCEPPEIEDVHKHEHPIMKPERRLVWVATKTRAMPSGHQTDFELLLCLLFAGGVFSVIYIIRSVRVRPARPLATPANDDEDAPRRAA